MPADDSAAQTRTCSYCDLDVLRTEVHKDSRGRYSCRDCRSRGRHLHGTDRLRFLVWYMVRGFWRK